MASGNLLQVTDEMLGQLSPDSREEFEWSRQALGSGADLATLYSELLHADAAAETIALSSIGKKKRVAKPRVSEEKLDQARARAFKQEVDNRLANNPGRPLREIEAEVRKDFQDIEDTDVSIEGKPVEAVGLDFIRDAHKLVQPFTVFAPRTVRAGGKPWERAGVSRETYNGFQDAFLREPLHLAIEDAREKFQGRSQERTDYIQERKKAHTKERLDMLFIEKYLDLKQEFSEAKGLKLKRHDPLPDEYSSHRTRMMQQASSEREAFVKAILPDLIGSGIAGAPAQGKWDRIAEASAEGHKGAMFTQLLRGGIRDEGGEEGYIGETYVSSVFRGGIGLLGTVASFPVKKLTWDRNPRTGQPYNKDGFIYRYDRYLDEKADELSLLSHDVRKEGYEGSKAKARMKLFFEGTGLALQKLVIGSGKNVEEYMYTPSDWTATWLEISENEWFGSNIAAMDNIHLSPHWYPTVAALVTELASPIRGTIAGAALGSVRPLTKVGAGGAAKIAKGLHADSVGEFFKNVERWGDSERSLLETVAARKAYEDTMKKHGVKVSNKERDGIELFEDFGHKMGPDVAARLSTVKFGEDPLRAKAFAGVSADDAYGAAVKRLAANRDLFAAALSGGAKWFKTLEKSPKGREILDLYKYSRRAMPRASFEAVGQDVMVQLAKKEMMAMLQDAIPNGWVRVSRNMVARKTAFRAVKPNVDRTMAKVAKVKQVLDVNHPDKIFFRFQDANKAYATALAGAGGDAFVGKNKKIFDKILKGGKLTDEEYSIAHTFMKNAVVERYLGKTGRSVVKGERISKRVYEGSKLGGSAKAAAVDREIGLMSGIEDMFRGVALTLSGKSDYIRAGFPNAKGKLGLIGIKAEDFGKTVNPVLLEHWAQTVSEINGLQNKLARVLEKGARDQGEANKLLRGVFEGDEVVAYSEIIEMFYAPSGKSIGDILGVGEEGQRLVGDYIREGLASGKIPRGAPTMEGIRSAIESVYGRLLKNDQAKLDRWGLKQKKAFYKLGGLSGKDDLGSLWSAYIVTKHAERIYDKSFKALDEMVPGMFLSIPDKASLPARASAIKQILKANGVDDAIAREITSKIREGFKSGVHPTNQREVAKHVMRYIYNNGFLPSQGEMSRIYDAVNKTFLKVAGEDNLISGIGRSWNSIKKGLMEMHVKANGGNPLNASQTAKANKDLDVITNAWVYALTDLDMDGVYGFFNQLGIRANAPKARELGDKVSVGFNLAKLPANKVAIFDDDYARIMEKYGEVDVIAKVNDSLSLLRPEMRSSWDTIRDFADTTRKITISGLLGGWVAPGLRFLGTNALTAPFIVGITAPGYFLRSVFEVPHSIGGSFARATRRTGLLTSSDAYDYATLELRGRPDKVLFQSPDGKMWTQKMVDDAADKFNIRFSRSTFDFQFDMLQDIQRMARIGPNGKPISDMKIFNTGLTVPYTGNAKRFWAFLRPDRKNIYSMVAEQMDNIHREAVFAQALKSGQNTTDAATLARASMLDYGALPDWSKRHVARNFAFFAFRYRMTADFMGALMRGGKGAKLIGNTGALIKSQYEDMQEWVITPDWAKTRFWKVWGKDFKQYSALHLGIQLPWSEGVMLLGNVAELFMNSEIGKIEKAADFLVATVDQLDPRVGAFVETYELSSGLRSNKDFAPNGYAPSTFLEFASSIPGMWNLVHDFMDLEVVKKDRERPDLPLIHGHQWKFGSSAGKQKFIALNFAMLVTGMKRSADDVPRAFARAGIDPKSIDWRRDSEGNLISYFVGGTTASVITHPEYLREIKRKYLYHTYQSMLKQPSL